MRKKTTVPFQGEIGESDVISIINSMKNVANGIAGLNSAAQLGLAQIPPLPSSILDFAFAWEKVAEVSATAACQEISVTNLAGDTDKWYMVLYSHVPVSSTATQFTTVLLNNDTVIGNYASGGFGITSANSWAGGVQSFGATSGYPGLPFIQTYVGDYGGIAIAWIHAEGRTVGTKTYVSMGSHIAPGVHGWWIGTGVWIKSAEVTEIDIYCPGGSYINAGSKVVVFRPKW